MPMAGRYQSQILGKDLPRKSTKRPSSFRLAGTHKLEIVLTSSLQATRLSGFRRVCFHTNFLASDALEISVKDAEQTPILTAERRACAEKAIIGMMHTVCEVFVGGFVHREEILRNSAATYAANKAGRSSKWGQPNLTMSLLVATCLITSVARGCDRPTKSCQILVDCSCAATPPPCLALHW